MKIEIRNSRMMMQACVTQLSLEVQATLTGGVM